MATGFIGLGNLGKAIATRLKSEGTDLIVWNRTRQKALDLGSEMADSPASLITKSEIVFLNLTNSNAVESVITGRNGLLDGECGGKIVVDTSTNHFDAAKRFNEMLKKKNVRYLESPVIGSVNPALQGNLAILVSGESGAYEAARPLLEKIGKKIFYLSQLGLATKMKLINNMVMAALMTSLAEAIVYGEEVGLGKEQVLEVLSAGAGNSTILTGKKDKFLKDDYSTHFSSAMMYKDLLYLSDLADSLKRPLFTGAAARELYAMTFVKKIENLDFSGVYKIMKEL